MDEEVAPHQIVDDAKGQAEQAAYQDKVGDGEPSGAEPVRDVDGRAVGMEEMPANGVWPGQEGDLADRDTAGDVEHADVIVEVDENATYEELEAARAAEQARLDAEDRRNADDEAVAEAQREADRIRAEADEQARRDAEAAAQSGQ